MEDELRAQLLANVGLAAIVAGRIDWDERPQGDPSPAIVLVLADPGYDYSQDGPIGFDWGRVHCHLWTASPREMLQLRTAAKVAFEALSAPLSFGFTNGFWRLAAPLVGAADARTPNHHAVLDVQVGFQNS